MSSSVQVEDCQDSDYAYVDDDDDDDACVNDVLVVGREEESQKLRGRATS